MVKILRMRAVSPAEWGGTEVLREIEVARPEPGVGEILIQVRAIGVNPTDWKSRATGGRKLWRNPPILGYDVSGIVTKVAEGSLLFHPGDEVFGMPLFPFQAGAYAEYLVGPARHFALKPSNIDHVHAAALPLAGLTAWQALVDGGCVRPGQRVLVHGAAGGVGHLAIQIAKSLGAYVIGTAQRPNHEFVRGLGADEVLDYKRLDFLNRLPDVDVVIDPIGHENGLQSIGVVRRGGILVSLVPRRHEATAVAATRAGVRYCLIVVEPDRVGMTALASLAESETIRPHVSTVLPLAQAKQAHELGEAGGTQGKIVLVP